MRAGRLHQRVTIEQVTGEARDGRGELTPTWGAFASNLPAAVVPLRGREFFEAHQENRELTHKIILRYLSGVTAKMRVNYGGRYFDIVSPPINVDEKNRELNLMCVERP